MKKTILTIVLAVLVAATCAAEDYFTELTGEEFDALLIEHTNIVPTVAAMTNAMITDVSAMTNAMISDVSAITSSAVSNMNVTLTAMSNTVVTFSGMTNEAITTIDGMIISMSNSLEYVAAMTNMDIIASNTVALSNATTAIDAASSVTNVAFGAAVAGIGFGNIDIADPWHNTSWTYIDLSAHVGTNAALVLLLVDNNYGGGNQIYFCLPGVGTDFSMDGVTCADVDANDKAYFWVPCDSNGMISVRTESSSFDINLIAWIRQHE